MAWTIIPVWVLFVFLIIAIINRFVEVKRTLSEKETLITIPFHSMTKNKVFIEWKLLLKLTLDKNNEKVKSLSVLNIDSYMWDIQTIIETYCKNYILSQTTDELQAYPLGLTEFIWEQIDNKLKLLGVETFSIELKSLNVLK